MNKKAKSLYKEFACDLCGEKDAIELPYVREYTNGQPIHICKNCGFVYVKKRRSSDEIAQTWSKQLFGKTYTAKSPLMLARHTYVAEFVNQNIGLKDKKVCDIGAGEGQFLNIIKRNYGAVVFGIEPSSFNCKLMEEFKINNYQGTLEEFLKTGSKYSADIVTLMWTLENAASCRDMLYGARQLLRNEGDLVVATGSRILVPFSKPLNLYLSTNPADTHAARFSVNSLTSLLNITGFKILHINPYLNDNLTLCIIAKKIKINKNARIKKDDFKQVSNFFKRWHKESLFYRQDK